MLSVGVSADPGDADDALYEAPDASTSSSDSIFETSAFSDVPRNSWYYSYVNDVTRRKIINGYPDNTFGPNRNLTRAEAVTILANCYAGSIGTYSSPFTDISNHWAKKSINWAYNLGIVNGITGTTFSPDSNITRQDFAVMIIRYCTKAELFTLPSYISKKTFLDDSSISSYAKDAVYTLQKAKIVSGKDGKRFYPTAKITRCEAAKIISSTYYCIILKTEDAKSHEEGTLGRVSLSIPVGLRCYSELHQKYRITSKSLTFYDVYNTVSLISLASNYGDIVLQPGGNGMKDVNITKGSTTVKARRLNEKLLMITGTQYKSDGMVYYPAYKTTIKGTYKVTGASNIALNAVEGILGVKSFNHSVSITF